jgi:hypothetical protein
MFIEAFRRLGILSPQAAQAIHVLTDLALRNEWRRISLTPGGLERLRALVGDDEHVFSTSYANDAIEPYEWQCDRPQATTKRGDR